MKFSVVSDDNAISIRVEKFSSAPHPLVFVDQRLYGMSDAEWLERKQAANSLVFQAAKFHELHTVLKSALLHDKKGAEAFRLDAQIGKLE